MKRFVVMLGYGLGGIIVALRLSLGAFALAGRQIGEPATPVQPAFSLSASPSPVRSADADPLFGADRDADLVTRRTTTRAPAGQRLGGDDHSSGGHHGGDD